jgi:hypothetical protein
MAGEGIEDVGLFDAGNLSESEMQSVKFTSTSEDLGIRIVKHYSVDLTIGAALLFAFGLIYQRTLLRRLKRKHGGGGRLILQGGAELWIAT